MSAMLWFVAVLRPVMVSFLVCAIGAFIPSDQRSGFVLGAYLLLWLVLMAWAGIHVVRRGASDLVGAAAAGAAVGCVLAAFFRGMSRWREPAPWLPDRLLVIFQPARVIATAAVIGLVGAWLLRVREIRNAT